MTLVAMHRDGWAVSDTRGIGPYDIFTAQVPKIIRIGNEVLIGFSGQWGLEQVASVAIAEMHEAPSKAAPILAQFLVDFNQRAEEPKLGVHVLIVNRRRELIYMEHTGVYYDVGPTDFWTIGGGAACGWGYLSAIAEHGKVLPVHAKQAIRVTSRREPGVGPDTAEQNLWDS